MRVFLDIVDRLFELSFQLLRPLPLIAVLSVFALLTAVLTLVVVRSTSDQKAIRRVKDRMGAHVLEVRLFSDQPGVVLRAYLSLLGNTVLYLRHSLRPFFVLAIPLLLLLRSWKPIWAAPRCRLAAIFWFASHSRMGIRWQIPCCVFPLGSCLWLLPFIFLWSDRWTGD